MDSLRISPGLLLRVGDEALDLVQLGRLLLALDCNSSEGAQANICSILGTVDIEHLFE